jgi:small subunit ribosomal protein S17
MTEQTVTRTVTGKVVSNKMNKSIVVLVERKIRHPKYLKYVSRSTKLHAHDENNQCHMGDVVKIRECRPRSKTKNWDLVEIVESAIMHDPKAGE